MSTYRCSGLIVQEGCTTFPAMKVPSSLADHDQRLVGHRVKALHLAKGWNSKTFAGMMKGVSPAKLGNWEAGTHMIPVWAAIQVAMLTGVDIRFIYRGNWKDVDEDFAPKVAECLRSIENQPPPRAPKAKPKRSAL